MRKVLLDASFILTAVRQKIDFFHELEMKGFQILIPEKVLREIKGLAERKLEAKLALTIIEKNKFQKIETSGRTVDASIINYSKENPSIFVATLDREIKTRTKNQKILIRQKRLVDVA